MNRDRTTNDTRGGEAYLVGIGFNPELVDAGQPVVEGTLVPETLFGTADAAVARLDGEARPLVPADGRACIVGRRAFAAHLVEAVALARVVVVPMLDELAGIEMRASIAFVVNALAVEHGWDGPGGQVPATCRRSACR